MRKKKKIAIYGLSTETEKRLPLLSERYLVIGLLDSFRKKGEIYGHRIIPFECAVAAGVELIIVVARPGSCKAIVQQIGNVCREHNIALCDIRGKDLLANSRVVYDFTGVKGYKYQDIIDEIATADAVSFDLFDTLAMRTVYSASDIIEILFARLKERGIKIADFSAKRLSAEKQLSQRYAPRLREIYEHVVYEADIEASSLAIMEYDLDKELLIPRHDVIKLLEASRKLGKRIYITTDTYYSREQIEEILVSIGINDYDGLLVSSEYRLGKTSGLYEKLLETAGTNNILHIGDDVVADIQSAKRHGLKCFQIYSGEELFDFLGGLGLSGNINFLSDRIKIGMFVADIFNSPFQFEDQGKKLKTVDAYDIGYLFCAPVIADFVDWFGQRAVSEKVENIWFCARDGYLIQRLFEKYYPGIRSDYFLTSRISAIRAGVEMEGDIEYVNSMKFGGGVEENLLNRFGIRIDEIEPSDIDESKMELLKYGKAILKNAAEKRINNLKYIGSLKAKSGQAAFFDFVAKGTNQMFVSRLTNIALKGLYFLQLEPEFMKDKNLDIQSFYTEEERETCAIYDNYYILETILTSPDASVEEFDADGHPVYAEETRGERDINCVLRVQNGILSYADRYLKICPRPERRINKKLDEAFLMLVHNVEIQDKDFLDLMIEDRFFNRMTNITDVL